MSPIWAVKFASLVSNLKNSEFCEKSVYWRLLTWTYVSPWWGLGPGWELGEVYPPYRSGGRGWG